jgi:hypothetical protein
MSLEKGIEFGKERRKPYRGSKSFDKHCRNNGGCGWCLSNRTVATRRREESAREKMKMEDTEWLEST